MIKQTILTLIVTLYCFVIEAQMTTNVHGVTIKFKK